jgi:UDP-N-acetylglucosamine 2-epimerase (non-hydrolysing)
MIKVKIVLTDFGEAGENTPFRVRPVLVVRDVTERGETIDLGTVKLVGMDRQRIIKETERVLDGLNEYLRTADRDACVNGVERRGPATKLFCTSRGDSR